MRTGIQTRHLSTALIALGLLAGPAFGQRTMTVREAVDQALREHPVLAATEARAAASAQLLIQSGLRPNPRVVLQTENWRSYGYPGFRANEDPDTFGYVTQLLETAGKRARRVELARAAQARAQLDRELLRKQIAGRVRQAYWMAVGLAKIHQLWIENVRNFRQVVEFHEIRVREGAMAEADLLKVRLESERQTVAANAAALDAERARIELFREMGSTDFPDAVLTEPLELGAPPQAADPRRAIEDRAEMKLARQLIEQARAGLGLEQANAHPDVDVVVGYKRTTGFHTLMAGAQVALPFFNRNQGNIGAAEAEIRAAQSEAAAMEALVRAEVRAAQTEVDLRRNQIVNLLERSLERAAESSRIAVAAYREGGADLLRLLDAERVRIELAVLYYRSLSEYRQSVSALETAIGMEP